MVKLRKVVLSTRVRRLSRALLASPPPALSSPPSRGRPLRAPQRRAPATASAEGRLIKGGPSPPACCGAGPAPANVALHRALPGCRPLRRGVRGGPPAPGAARREKYFKLPIRLLRLVQRDSREDSRPVG